MVDIFPGSTTSSGLLFSGEGEEAVDSLLVGELDDDLDCNFTAGDLGRTFLVGELWRALIDSNFFIFLAYK